MYNPYIGDVSSLVFLMKTSRMYNPCIGDVSHSNCNYQLSTACNPYIWDVSLKYLFLVSSRAYNPCIGDVSPNGVGSSIDVQSLYMGCFLLKPSAFIYLAV